MNKSIQHTRLLSLPVPEPISAGQLDVFYLEKRGRRTDLLLEYHARAVKDSPRLSTRDGQLFEESRGVYLPRRLRFTSVERLEISGPYLQLDSLPPEHASRTIVEMYAWQGKGENLPFFLLFGRSKEDAEICFHARTVRLENRTGDPIPFTHAWDWSPAPPMPARLVPSPLAIHQRFGGDPIAIRFDGKVHPRRLFVGGLEIEPLHRPDVDAVLNLGEEKSRWVKEETISPPDRWAKMGEGSQGMTPEEILHEAEWVLERLHSGKRVLIHCVAGMNRSVTIACAVLILSEGLTAQAALQHLRAHHPWARPDGHHWLALKCLASGISSHK